MTPIASAWVDASKAICEGQLTRAAEIIDGVGHLAAAAYAHLRAATGLEAAGDATSVAAERALAEPFYTEVGAVVQIDGPAWFGSTLGARRH